MSEQVGKIKTGNTEWQVRVEGHRFVATAPGFNPVSGDSWDQMENNAKVQASKAKVKVSVPYVDVSWGYNDQRQNAPRFNHKTATGINAGTGNVTYRDSRGQAGQETYGRGFMKPLSDEDAAEYLRLLREIHDLEGQRDEIARKYAFPIGGGLKRAVQDEIDAEHKRREEASQA